MEFDLRVNGQTHTVDVEPDMPVLYVLMNDLELQGPRFGCGMAQCGSCSVLVDGREIRSCVTPVSSIGDQEVTTLEGLPEWFARGQGVSPARHPMQQAMIDQQAVQCGYCSNGIIVKAAELLAANSAPTDPEIRSAMNGHLCRCGTYPRILEAIHQASRDMRG